MSRDFPPSPDARRGEIIVEFVRNGPYLKCTAVDAASGVEASAVGPVTERGALERIAVAKLQRQLARR